MEYVVVCGDKFVGAGRLVDALRWVAQEARGVIMSGYTGPNHEKLRAALAMLKQIYEEEAAKPTPQELTEV